MSEPQPQSDLQRAWYKEGFAVQRAIKYHARRQGFYDFWNNLTNAASVLLAAATIAALAHKLPLAEVLSILFPVVITILSTLNLVWGTSRRARVHNDLYRRFAELERKMVCTKEIDEQVCRSLRGERVAIEADEPPTMFVVKVLCHNEVVRANGTGEYFKVPLWQRCLAHLWAFPNATFTPVRSAAT